MKNLLLSAVTTMAFFVSWDIVSADPDFPNMSKNARIAPVDTGSRHSPHQSPSLRPVQQSPSAPQLSLQTSSAPFQSSPEPMAEKAQTFRSPKTTSQNIDDGDKKKSVDSHITKAVDAHEIAVAFSTMFNTVFSKLLAPKPESSSPSTIVEDDTTQLETPALKHFLQSQLHGLSQSKPADFNSYERDSMLAFAASLYGALPELCTSCHAKPFLRKAEQLALQVQNEASNRDNFGEFFGNYMANFTEFIDLVKSDEMHTMVKFIEQSEKPTVQLVKHSFKALEDNKKNDPAVIRTALEDSQKQVEGFKTELTAMRENQQLILRMLQQQPQFTAPILNAGDASAASSAAGQPAYPQSVILRNETANGVRVTTQRVTTGAPVNGVDVFSSLRMTATPDDEKGK